MQKYWMLFQKTFQSQMAYRSTTLLTLLSAAVSFVIQVSLWTALIQSGVKDGITLSDMVVYIVLNTVILTVTRADIASDIEIEIRDGSVAMHLLRPISFKLYWLSTVMGKNCYKLCVSTLPIVILGAVFAGFSAPKAWWHVLFALISTVLGTLIMFEITYIVGLIAFWVQKTWYLSFYLKAGTTLFGGTTVPFWFYPELLNQLSYFLPFRYISFEAISLYLGKMTFEQGLFSLLCSAVWLAVLEAVGLLVWRSAQTKLCVNGG